MVNVSAIVVSGRGMAADTRTDEVATLSKQLNTSLVSGSLNLVAKKPLWLDEKSAIYTTNQGHMYWEATLNGLPVLVNRWKGDCPAHIYEIYANTKLRTALKLKDGAVVHLDLNRITVDMATSKNIKHIVTWYLIWFCRETFYYTNNKYLAWIKRAPFKRYIWRSIQM